MKHFLFLLFYTQKLCKSLRRLDTNDSECDVLCLCCSISPLGMTPRSDRVRSAVDEIEEDIEEDLSVAEDLLRSDRSGVSTGQVVSQYWSLGSGCTFGQ